MTSVMSAAASVPVSVSNPEPATVSVPISDPGQTSSVHNRQQQNRTLDERFSYVAGNESSSRRHKVQAEKLTGEKEFLMWYEAFYMYVASFPWYKVFDLENPVPIPETDFQARMEARGCLYEWLDDEHRKIIFKEMDPFICMLKIKQYCEPQAKLSDYLWGKIYKLEYNPRFMVLAEWLKEFESLNRQLVSCHPDWTDKRKINCFVQHMVIPFPNLNVTCAELRLKNLEKGVLQELSYEQIRKMATEEEELLRARDDMYKRSKGANYVENKLFKGNKRLFKPNRNISGGRRVLRNCYVCGKPGHLAKDCWHRDDQSRGTGSSRAPQEEEQSRGTLPLAPQQQQSTAGGEDGSTKERRYKAKEGKRKPRYHKRHYHKSRKHGARRARRSSSSSSQYSSSSSSGGSRRQSRNRSRGDRTDTGIDGSAFVLKNLMKYKALWLNNRTRNNIQFIGDSGATDHFVSELSVLKNVEELDPPKVISCANKNDIANIIVTHRGTIWVKELSGKVRILEKVLYSKDMSENLFSFHKICRQNCAIILHDMKCEIYCKKTGDLLFVGKKVSKYWFFELELCAEKSAFAITSNSTLVNDGEIPSTSQGFSSTLEHSYTRQHDAWSDSDEDEPNQFVDRDLVNRIEPTLEHIDEGGQIEYLDLGSNVTIEDLKAIDETSHESIRKKTGLLYHLRLGHASQGYLEKAKKHCPELKNIDFGDEIRDCEACKLGKVSKRPHKSVREICSVPLGRIHSDLIGPIKPVGVWKKSVYILTFTCDFSRHTMAYCIPDKNGIAEAFLDYMTTMRAFIGNSDAKIMYLRTDGGREYMTNQMKFLIRQEDIILERCPPDTPELNGVSERINRTILQKLRALLIDSGLPLEFWELALNQVIHVHNRLPHKRLNFVSPYEVLKKKAPNLKYIHRFGCIAYRKIPYDKSNTVSKMSPRGEKCILLGCNADSWELLNVENGKFYKSSNVEFTESVMFKHKYPPDHFKRTGFPKFDIVYTDDGEFEVDLQGDLPNPNVERVYLAQENAKRAGDDFIGNQLKKLRNRYKYDSQKESDSETEVREFRVVEYRRPEYRKIEKKYFALMCHLNEVPKNYREVLVSKEKDNWLKAIEAELSSQYDNKTWEYVKRPKSKEVIDSRWVFTNKTDVDGSIRYKARLVSRGFKDHHIYNYSETYAPVVGLADVRTLFAIANRLNWHILQMDVDLSLIHISEPTRPY